MPWRRCACWSRSGGSSSATASTPRVGDLTTLAIPETLTALIAARLDALEPADRSLLLDAAVLGQSFTPAGLAAVSGSEASVIEPRLRALVRREILTLSADPRSPERGQYAFVQALIREVAYNTLSRRDRRDRHLAAARFFESLGSDELAGALAGHYLAAHENAAEGPEADALAAQARIALRAAADRAAALGSHAQAVGLFEQAAGVTTDTADLADLLERQAESIMLLADYEGAAARIVRARRAPGAPRRPACARPPGGRRGSCPAEREAGRRVAGAARGGRRRVRRPGRDPRARRGPRAARPGLLPRRGPSPGDRGGRPRPRDRRARRPHAAARRHAGDQGLRPRHRSAGSTRPRRSSRRGGSWRRRPA